VSACTWSAWKSLTLRQHCIKCLNTGRVFVFISHFIMFRWVVWQDKDEQYSFFSTAKQEIRGFNLYQNQTSFVRDKKSSECMYKATITATCIFFLTPLKYISVISNFSPFTLAKCHHRTQLHENTRWLWCSGRARTVLHFLAMLHVKTLLITRTVHTCAWNAAVMEKTASTSRWHYNKVDIALLVWLQ